MTTTTTCIICETADLRLTAEIATRICFRCFDAAKTAQAEREGRPLPVATYSE